MHDDLSRLAASAARALLERGQRGDTARRIVDIVATEVTGCDAVTLSVVERERTITTPAATHPSAAHGDRLQAKAREGPHLDATHHGEVVRAPDLARDDRWPTWGARMAQESGYQSMLALRLYTGRNTVGVLTLYSRRRHGFSVGDESTAAVLAAIAAVALADERQIENLEVALQRRTQIGRAQGVLMERFGLDADHAFALLTRLSSHLNRKLHDICSELLATGRLPDDPTRSAETVPRSSR